MALAFFIPLCGAVALLLLLRSFLQGKRGYLESLGIPVDRPAWAPFLLSPSPLGLHRVSLHRNYQEKFRRLGAKTYGRYEGVRPVVVTMDPEVMKSVLVKNFDCFTDVFFFIDTKNLKPRHTPIDVSMLHQWQVLRKNFTPVFTQGKLNAMMEPMSALTDETMKHAGEMLRRSPDGELDMDLLYQGLSVNIAGHCLFGIDARAHERPDQELIRHSLGIFSGLRCKGWADSAFVHLITHFPCLEKLLSVWPRAFDQMWDIMEAILEQASSLDGRPSEMLQRLTDLRRKVRDPSEEASKHLSDDIIVTQGVPFFIGSFVSISTVLSSLSYFLAKNQRVQETLYREIKDVFYEHEGVLDKRSIDRMSYLEACMKETVRIRAPITYHNRLCTRDVEVVPGLKIKKGVIVEMPIYACHQTEEYFPEPGAFRPERFLESGADQIVPYTYRPFGEGPRKCLGERFAMLEIKIAVIKLLSVYQMLPTENTGWEDSTGDFFLSRDNSKKLKLRLVKRQ